MTDFLLFCIENLERLCYASNISVYYRLVLLYQMLLKTVGIQRLSFAGENKLPEGFDKYSRRDVYETREKSGKRPAFQRVIRTSAY